VLEATAGKSGGASGEVSPSLHKSNKELGISLEEIHIFLPEMHKSSKKTHNSLAHLCISSREIGIFLRETYFFLEDLSQVKGGAKRFFWRGA